MKKKDGKRIGSLNKDQIPFDYVNLIIDLFGKTFSFSIMFGQKFHLKSL